MNAPSTTEYQAILNELNEAEAALSQLKIHAAYEKAPAPEGSGHLNLLSFLTRGQKQQLAGAALKKSLVATEQRVEVLQGLLVDFNEREQAFRDWEAEQIPEAV